MNFCALKTFAPISSIFFIAAAILISSAISASFATRASTRLSWTFWYSSNRSESTFVATTRSSYGPDLHECCVGGNVAYGQ